MLEMRVGQVVFPELSDDALDATAVFFDIGELIV